MNELLFNSLIEKEALENILALNQIKKCDAEIEKYTNEIKEQNEKMIQILKDEDIDESYIEKIHKYKNLLVNIAGDNGRISELDDEIKKNEDRINEFQEKITEIETKLEELKKEIFETNDPSKVIDCQNEIENNNVRLNDLNEILSGLISENTPLLIEKEYLVAKNSDFDFNIPNYNKNEISVDLEKITNKFNEAIEKLELTVRENIEFCQKKIKNREIEINKFNERKNRVIEAYPKCLDLDMNRAFTDIERLLRDLDLKQDNINEKCEHKENIFNDMNIELSVIKPEEKKGAEIKDEMILVEENEELENIYTDNEETTNEVIEEENKENIIEEKNEEIGSVSYVLSDGESLINIAEKVYPSKDNWEAIYYFNKDEIDKYLISNGISNDFDTIKELSNDTSLFTGIKLEIPTDYNYKI